MHKDEISPRSNADLKIVTLNVWGLPFAANREFRIQSIAKRLLSLSPDIIGLQEVWIEKDRDVLQRCLASHGLVHSKYFRSGVLGSGLLTISRYPFTDTIFHKFSLSGMPEKVHHGEYFSGKGVGLTRILTPIAPIDVYNLQPIAQHSPDSEDEYRYQRIAAIYEVVEFVNSNSHDNPVLAMGDYNIRPDQFEYRLIETLAGLVDCYAVVNPEDPGVTITPENPYQHDQRPKRIDYVFARDGSTTSIKPIVANVTMKFIEGHESSLECIPYSDHFAIFVCIKVSKKHTEEASNLEFSSRSNICDRYFNFEFSFFFRQAIGYAKRRRNSFIVRAILSALAAWVINGITPHLPQAMLFSSGIIMAISRFILTLYSVACLLLSITTHTNDVRTHTKILTRLHESWGKINPQ